MKKQSPPAHSPGTPPIPLRHQLDHAVPTVIHNPEEDMTALGRLTFHILQEPRKYSTWGLSLLLGIIAVTVVVNVFSGGTSRSSVAWAKLEAAKKVEQRVEVAKEFPRTTAAQWALLQAASEYYMSAFNDLPRNPEVALQGFKKSLDLFDQVYREVPNDSFQARAALLGTARSLEASNDLPKAIEKYELVIKNWPGSAEAEQAKQLAGSLKNADAASFYKQLYAYSPPKVTLPPMGSQEIPLPEVGIGLPAGNTAVPPLPTPLITTRLGSAPPSEVAKKSLGDAKPAPSQPAPKAQPAATAKPKTDLPVDVLAPESTTVKKKK